MIYIHVIKGKKKRNKQIMSLIFTTGIKEIKRTIIFISSIKTKKYSFVIAYNYKLSFFLLRILVLYNTKKTTDKIFIVNPCLVERNANENNNNNMFEIY